MKSSEDRERFQPLGPAKKPETPPARPADAWTQVKPGVQRNGNGQLRTNGDAWDKDKRP